MKSLRDIKELVGRVYCDGLRVRISDEMDKRIVGSAQAAMKSTREARLARDRLSVWELIMKTRIMKYGFSMVVCGLVAAGCYLYWMNGEEEVKEWVSVTGVERYELGCGSMVVLDEGCEFLYLDGADVREIELVVGGFEIDVVKDDRQLVVKTMLGNVKALGTRFSVGLGKIRGDNGDGGMTLAVGVMEGRVEVANEFGVVKVGRGGRIAVVGGSGPYDYRGDDRLPARLVERIDSMCDAFANGDARGWASNFDMETFYRLLKGEIELADHREWFSDGLTDEQLARNRKLCEGVTSVEEMMEIFIASVNIREKYNVYIESVTLSEDGKHARAICVKKAVKPSKYYTKTDPDWAYYNGDWWQIDD